MKMPVSKEERKQIRPTLIIITFTLLLAAALFKFSTIWSFVQKVFKIAEPFFIGLGLAYIMNPALLKLEKYARKWIFKSEKAKKPCRYVCTAVTLLGLTGIVVLIMYLLVPQLIVSVKSIAQFITRFLRRNAAQINQLTDSFDIVTIDGDELIVAWENILSSVTKQFKSFTSLLGNVVSISSSVVSFLYRLLVALITSFYMLADKERILGRIKKITYAFIKRDSADGLVTWCRQANRIFTGFLFGKILDSLIVGALCYITMLIFGWEYPILISVVIGVLNIIPFFGPFIGWAPCALILLMINPMHALWFSVFILVLQQLDGNVIGPHILGDYTGVSALNIMIAIVVGSGLFGFTGMLLGVPTYALLYAIIRYKANKRLAAQGMPCDAGTYANAPESFTASEDKAAETPDEKTEEEK